MRGAGQSIHGVLWATKENLDLKRLSSTVLSWTDPRTHAQRTAQHHFQPMVVRRHHRGTGAPDVHHCAYKREPSAR